MPRKIRYAVVGLGHIAQVAVLPAFRNASANSVVTALVSDDPEKLEKVGRKYGVKHLYSYGQYEECLRSGEIDAVYIALPNHLHLDYTVRAAESGIHVLCEKPMAVTARDCERMIRAAARNNVRLMIAYRLHFEEANLNAVEMVRNGVIGEPRLFSSVFTMNVKEGDIRLQKRLGGGTLYDIGVYCINAARYLFRAEPIEVLAAVASKGGRRFSEVEEMVSATLRFPDERLATFTCSFGSSDVAEFRIVGTKGDLRLDPAYEYAQKLEHTLTINGKKQRRTYVKHDQFAPELIYFSDCIIKRRIPEPSGVEGLADIRIVEALYKSARSRRPVKLVPMEKRQRPTKKQNINKPGISKPTVVKATPPSK